MDRLKGKTAIVTGGSHGIGLAICEMFAAEGANVLIADIDREAGEALAAKICSEGQIARFCYSDVSSSEDAKQAAAVASEWNGGIDVLCNNAAYTGPFHAVLESTELEWTRCIQVSLMGSHYFTRESLPSMIRQKRGSIVNIVSIQAIAGCMTSVSYTAVKAALLGYTLSAAYDYGPHNVRVNSLCPGPIQTRISPQPGTPHYEWQCNQTMLGRVGYPPEVAQAALFLASDESSYITGVTLPVDGGWAAK
jgi:NAD(P)-dependent dehydrogenase (short-subunit alcohol dehydrogenase family)